MKYAITLEFELNHAASCHGCPLYVPGDIPMSACCVVPEVDCWEPDEYLPHQCDGVRLRACPVVEVKS